MMEDTREWLTCDECAGEFAVETDCSMDVSYCVFCGEPLDILEWEGDKYANELSEVEG